MSLQLKNRTKELQACLLMLACIENELTYSLAEIPTILSGLLNVDELLCLRFLKDTLELMRRGQPFKNAWEQAVRQSSQLFLPGDRDILLRLSGVLGASDAPSQIKELHACRAMLEVQLKQAREKAKTHGRLYQTIGVLGAVSVFIVLW